jgi:uncharacterized membrane protein YdbT with pleckstrin-like domain
VIKYHRSILQLDGHAEQCGHKITDGQTVGTRHSWRAQKGFAVDAIQRLDQMRLFDTMLDASLVRWAGTFRREHHRRGSVIARPGDTPAAFYIVDQGELRARARVDDQDVPRAYYYPGDFFGETGLLTGEPHEVTVDVLTDAELLVLESADFDLLVEEHPEIREKLFTMGNLRDAAGRLRFPWQELDEVTLFFSTKHWIVLVREAIWVLLLAFIATLASFFYLTLGLGVVLAAILMVVAGALWAFTVFVAFYLYYDWRNDHYIITNLRVLHVERVLALREDRDEAPTDRIQDVQVQQEGVLANLLDYGNVVIQTAATMQKTVFNDVPHPDVVQQILFAPMHYGTGREEAALRESIRQELGQRLNVPATSPEDRVRSESRDGPESAAEEETAETEEGAFEPLRWVRPAWDWLGGVFTFETWIVTDGGNTITWRKNGWLLVRESLAPLFSGLFVAALFLVFLSQGIGFPIVPGFLFLVLLCISGWWFYRYWDWQNDIYQISGNRLVDLKRRPLWLEELRRETTLERIQNIGLSIPGAIAQLFNYGTVIIETAGETGAFVFENVHDPRGVQEEIFRRRERYTQQQRQEETLKRHAELGDWFEVYDELRQENDFRKPLRE